MTPQVESGSPKGRVLVGIFVTLVSFVFLLPWASVLALTVQGPPVVTPEVHHDVSPPLAHITLLLVNRQPRQIFLGMVPHKAFTYNYSASVTQFSACTAFQK